MSANGIPPHHPSFPVDEREHKFIRPLPPISDKDTCRLVDRLWPKRPWWVIARSAFHLVADRSESPSSFAVPSLKFLSNLIIYYLINVTHSARVSRRNLGGRVTSQEYRLSHRWAYLSRKQLLRLFVTTMQKVDHVTSGDGRGAQTKRSWSNSNLTMGCR